MNHTVAKVIMTLFSSSMLLLAVQSAARAEDLSWFEARLKPYESKPDFVAPGPAFDARSCMRGKSIMSIPQSSANPFTATIEKAMQAVADKVGFKFTTWENQGQSSQPESEQITADGTFFKLERGFI